MFVDMATNPTEAGTGASDQLRYFFRITFFRLQASGMKCPNRATSREMRDRGIQGRLILIFFSNNAKAWLAFPVTFATSGYTRRQ